MTEFQKVAESLKWKKNDNYCATKLGMSLEDYQSTKRTLKKLQEEEVELESFNEGYSEDLTSHTAEYKVQTDHCPKSSEEIERMIRLDKSKWKILKYSVRNGSKPDVWLMTIQVGPADKLDSGEAFAKALKDYKSDYKPSYTVYTSKEKDKYCVLVSLPDFHLDKLTVGETPIQDHIDNYNRILRGLVEKARLSYNVDEIVFVIGNDFYHTDSLHNTTTKGTGLFVGTEWDNAYELGFDLMVKSITYLKQYCNKLNIILTPGNHSITKEFYLAHALEVYFKPDKNIIFNRSKDDQKVHRYGETLLCFSHGNNVNDKLPLAFATSFYKEWGSCRFKEIILGDKHHNSEKLYKTQGEAMGIRMRIIPSLSGTDQWHKDNLFIGSIQAGICLVYHEKFGKCAEFEERI